MSTLKGFAAPVAALLLVGCVGPRPSVPPDAAVFAPDQWRDSEELSNADLPAQWWKAFDDPALTHVVESAMRQNVDMAIAANRVSEAIALLRASRGAQLPQVSIEVSGGPQRTLNPFGMAQEQTVGVAQLLGTYEIDLFGRLASATDAARAGVLSVEAARDSLKLAVAATAASSYIGLRALDARLRILEATRSARSEALDIARRRAQAGYAPVYEERQALAELQATEAQIAPTALAVRRQEHALRVLLGEVPGDIERGGEIGTLQRPMVEPGIPSQLMRRRPDIRQAEQNLVAADYSLDHARAALLPAIRLGARAGAVDSTLLADPIAVFSIGGSILAPLIEGGRLRALADAAASRRDQAAYAYRRTVLNAFREVTDGLAAVAAADTQVDRLVAQHASLGQVLDLATARYRAGYAAYLEQLDAQRALLGVELNLAQARADSLLARVGLYQALGGGWEPGGTPLLAR